MHIFHISLIIGSACGMIFPWYSIMHPDPQNPTGIAGSIIMVVVFGVIETGLMILLVLSIISDYKAYKATYSLDEVFDEHNEDTTLMN
jgi:hypothetical protein